MQMSYEMDRVAIRMVKEPPLMSDRPIRNPLDAVEIMHEFLQDLDREMVAIVNLHSDGKPSNMNVMSIGTINASYACPREALKTSILSNASAVMLFHNHPSGNLEPSGEDIIMTSRMIKAYNLMEINVLDHIILGPGDWFYSMREHGQFEISAQEYSLAIEDLDFRASKPRKQRCDDAR